MKLWVVRTWSRVRLDTETHAVYTNTCLQQSAGDDPVLAAFATVVLCGLKVKCSRQYWVRPSLRNGRTHNIIQDLPTLSPAHMNRSGSRRIYIQMAAIDFKFLLKNKGPATHCLW